MNRSLTTPKSTARKNRNSSAWYHAFETSIMIMRFSRLTRREIWSNWLLEDITPSSRRRLLAVIFAQHPSAIEYAEMRVQQILAQRQQIEIDRINAERDAAAEREIAAGTYISDKLVRGAGEENYENDIDQAMMSAWEENEGVNRDFFYRNWWAVRYGEPVTYQKSKESCWVWAHLENDAFDSKRAAQRQAEQDAKLDLRPGEPDTYLEAVEFSHRRALSEYAQRREAGYVQHIEIARDAAMREEGNRILARILRRTEHGEPDTYVWDIPQAEYLARSENYLRDEAAYASEEMQRGYAEAAAEQQ